MKSTYVIPVILVICHACTLAPDVTSVDAGHAGIQPALHAIHSEKLRNIMLRMNTLVYEREYTALQVDAIRAEHLKALIDTTGDLVYAAETLTESVPAAELSPQDQTTFKAMANQLYTEAAYVEILAKETNFTDLDAAYQRLNETCEACHRLFRDK